MSDVLVLDERRFWKFGIHWWSDGTVTLSFFPRKGRYISKGKILFKWRTNHG